MGPRRIVHVRWLDSRGLGESWEEQSDVLEKARTLSLGCESAGFLIHEDGQGIVISHSLTDEHFHGGLKIPLAAIVELRTCEVPDAE